MITDPTPPHSTAPAGFGMDIQDGVTFLDSCATYMLLMAALARLEDEDGQIVFSADELAAGKDRRAVALIHHGDCLVDLEYSN